MKILFALPKPRRFCNLSGGCLIYFFFVLVHLFFMFAKLATLRQGFTAKRDTLTGLMMFTMHLPS